MYKPVNQEEEKFLKNYKPGDYERPSVTVDNVIFRLSKANELEVLLIKRGGYPYKGYWALPGGFIQPNETAEEAAKRELEEETGIKDAFVEQLYFETKPERDPRMWVMSSVHMGFVPKGTEVKGGDDAKEARWLNVASLGYALRDGRMKLAFDHNKFLAVAIARLRNKAYYTNILFNLLPKDFTLYELEQVYKTVFNESMHKPNFRKRIMSRVEPTGKRSQEYSYRPAEIYQLKEGYVVDKDLNEPDFEKLFPYQAV